MISGWQSWSLKLGLVSFLALCESITFSGDYAKAQIIPDSTLGKENSLVTPSLVIRGLPSNRIDGGAVRGTNLFHSFLEFNIDEGQGAYFTNPDGIENILSRITGSNQSNILGKLGVLGNANLFFLNPNGTIFGVNATLDVDGSVVVSTANSVVFNNNFEFSATNPEAPPLLTVNLPLGLQYRANSGKILVQGNGQGLRTSAEPIDTAFGLRVQPNKTLALVGGDVLLIGGTLKTAGGRIELGSVADFALVNLTPTDKGWALGYSDATNFADIDLSGTAAVDASGAGGGEIQVRGRRVTLRDGSQIEASTLGAELGGTLNITASDLVELRGISTQGEFSVLGVQVYPQASGAGGDLTVETGRLIVQDGARITTSTFGKGSSGNLTIKADDSVEVIGLSRLFTQVVTETAGAGGNLTVETERLIVRDGARISTASFGAGSSGNLTIRADDFVELVGVFTFADAGIEFTSGLFTSVQQEATGNAGNLTIETGQLIVQDGAVISARTFSSPSAGNLTIKASDSVELIGKSASGRLPSSLTAATTGTGNAGDLTVETGQLIVRDGAELTVSGEGQGNAGNLEVIAHNLRLDNQAILSATTASGQGGNILLQLDSLLLLRRNSQISTTAGTAQTGGDGGNIKIDTNFIVAVPNENSDITANAFAGSGGQVEINAQGIFSIEPRSRQQLQTLLGTNGPTQLDPSNLPSNDITAISQTNPSLSGQVSINTPDVDPTQGIAELASEPVTPQPLQGCQANQGQGKASFVSTGRGGLPLSPEEISSNTFWEDLRPPTVEVNATSNTVSVTPSRSSPARIVEAQGWVKLADGKVILTAQAPVLSPSQPGQLAANCFSPG